MELVGTITLAVITAVVIGLVQVFKGLGLPAKWCPLAAIACGVLATLGLSLFEANFSVIMTGIIIGLTAVGLYSGTRATVGN